MPSCLLTSIFTRKLQEGTESYKERLLLAYLLKHNIYVGNDDGTDKELSSEERRNAWKTLQMVDGLENVSYLKSLEDK